MELGLRICERIAAGALLKDAAARFKLPAETVCRWTVRHPEFRQAYARAREDRTEIWAEQMLDIALDGSRDYDKDGKLRKESVLRSKLIIETMQWQMVRLDPRLWSEKKRVEASVQTTVAAMPPEQREAMVQGILKRLGLEEQRAKKSRIVHVTPKPEPATVAAPKKGAIRR